MNFSKSKVLLKKINAIHDSAEAFDEKFSSLERDLMLQYLRDLYECVVSDDDAPVVARATPEKITPEPRVRDEYVPQPRPKALAPVAEVSPTRPAPAPAPEPQVQVERPVAPAPVVEEVVVPPSKEIDPELEELFSIKRSNDLSTRLANAPVSDINRAIGINERILTINELFKGDQQAYNKVVSDLNGLASFEEAKNYLIEGIATDNEWASAKKSKKAQVFIKLISRRYQ